MDLNILSHFYHSLPFGITLVAIILFLYLLHWILSRQAERHAEFTFRKQLVMICAFILTAVVLLIALPVKDELRGQLFSLFGILLSAIIALSSTTVVGNMMAGLMLRGLNNFHLGDFLRVGEHFGRVSAIGLLHVEIQTEDRDLKTFPNLFLVSQPVTVIHSTGTIISSEVTIGYDVPHQVVEKFLLEAALQADLKDPFVQITELGNFSIHYRIAGLLSDVKQILSSRSRLRANILNQLHHNKIEIASPTLMSTRQYPQDFQYIPSYTGNFFYQFDEEQAQLIEDVVFDKAEKAASMERLKNKVEEYLNKIDELKASLDSSDGKELEVKKHHIQRLEKQIERIKTVLEKEKDNI